MPVTRNYTNPAAPARELYVAPQRAVPSPLLTPGAITRYGSPGVRRDRKLSSLSGAFVAPSAPLAGRPDVRRPGLGFLALTTYPAIYKTWRGVSGPVTVATPREFPPLYVFNRR